MMNSALVIALTIACSNGVWAYTIPTTVPPTTVPDVCYTYGGIAIAVGMTYGDKHVGGGLCRVYECVHPPDAYPHTECYDVTTDRCVNVGSTQIIDGCEQLCAPPGDEGFGWVDQDCYTSPPTPTPPTSTPHPTTTTPLPTTTTPLPTTTTQPPTTTTPPPGCNLNGVQYPVGEIPDSGGCFCDTSGHVMCP